MGIYKYDRESYEKNGMSELLSKISNPHEIFLGYTDEVFYTQDYTKLTNMFVTGTTGSGKTAFILSLLTEIMNVSTPYDVKFVIFDSKKVDYVYLNGNPYLQIPVLTDTLRTNSAIQWLLAEATNRITDQFLSSKPHIFVVLDDFFEMSTKESNISESLIRLLQIGRAAKIHVIVVSSTPSSQIVWTELKANLPFKVSFRTANKHVSRMVIDDVGAELLSFPGEMIYIGQEGRFKCYGVFAEPEELEAASKLITENCIVPQEIIQRDMEAALAQVSDNYLRKQGILLDSYPYNTNSIDIDYLLDDAARTVLAYKSANIGLLQRKLKIGFNRAARLMDLLCEIGIVDDEWRTKTSSPCILISYQDYEGIAHLVCNAKCEEDLNTIAEKTAALKLHVEKAQPTQWDNIDENVEYTEKKSRKSLIKRLIDRLI